MEYKTISRLVYLATGIFIAIWFAQLIINVILLLFFAIVITIVLNAPVTWLQEKKMSRSAASLLVFFGVLTLFGLVGWMVIPKMVTQVNLLIKTLPHYIGNLNHRINDWLGDNASGDGQTAAGIPFSGQLSSLVGRIGQYSLGVMSTLLMVIFFFCLVIYMLTNPRPLLELYLSCFRDDKKDKAAEAFAYASRMTIGWMWSNVMAGALRATIVGFFLYFMGIPGVWVWAGVTFFAELIPKIGFYIMSVPPILIAFSISPVTALWVAAFYLALDELIGDFVIPRLRSKTMKIHPVSILVMLLAMSAAFGVMGAFIATPLVAFIKAYHETFYWKEPHPEKTAAKIDKMLLRK
ncbi:MAG: AI-2E family transporter [Bacteroidota bacterium]|nr:AI-2E family transporter [Bacteroidota bacterium]